MQISKKGLDLIKSFESFKAKPYLDYAKIPTIGYGTILYPDNTKVKMTDQPITEEMANTILKWNVGQKCAAITSLVRVVLNQNQFDALSSLVYNIGVQAFKSSHLLVLINSGKYDDADNQFVLWDMAAHKVVNGLLDRRKKEAALFMEPV